MSFRRIYTLVFLKQNQQVLLGLKTRGLGVGKWNGFGGKVEPPESIMDGAKRELLEECNVTASLKHIGVLQYEVEDNPEIAIVHVFTAGSFAVPFNNMWPDAKYWFNLMLQDRYFSVFVKYNANGNIEKKLIKEDDTLEGALKSNL